MGSTPAPCSKANSLIERSDVNTLPACESRSLATGSSGFGCMVNTLLRFPPSVGRTTIAYTHYVRHCRCGGCVSRPGSERVIAGCARASSLLRRVAVSRLAIAVFQQFLQRVRERVVDTPQVRNQIRATDEADAEFTVERH